MRKYPGLGKYLKVGSSIGLVCFIFLWLGAILWPSFGDFMFAKYDLLTPYSIIQGVTGIVFDGPHKEGGILFVLLSWAIYTVLGAMLVSFLAYVLTKRFTTTVECNVKRHMKAEPGVVADPTSAR